MEKQEIKLTEKQLQIFSKIMSTKGLLENEVKRNQEAESDFLVNLCESKGVSVVQGIEYKDGSIFVPVEGVTEAEVVESTPLKKA